MWLPTLWGTLTLLAIAAACLFALGFWAYDLLAPTDPARGRDGRGARTLVVEGWMNAGEFQQVIDTLHTKRYERVLTTGGPIEPWMDAGQWHTYAARAEAYLRANGAADVPVTAVAAPASAQDRTYLSAVVARDWARQSGVTLDAIDLYSVGVHTRRSRMVFRMALGDAVEVGAIAARPTEYDAQRWWTSSSGAKTTVGEALSVIWTACCFWPGRPGTHEERWGVPAASAARP